MKHSTPIQKRLMRMVMFICGTVLLLTCLAFFVYEYISFREITKRELATLGEVTAANLTSSLAFDDRDDATELLQALQSRKNIVLACAYDSTGAVFASFPSSLKPERLPSANVSESYQFTDGYLVGYQPVVQKGRRMGTLFVRSDVRSIYDRLLLYGAIGLLFIGVSFFFAYLLSRRLQGTVVNPVLQLAAKARIVSEKKDYSIRAEKRSDDELGVLTDAFNHMLTQIQLQNEEIVALNANLEEKIALRTAELQQANSTLREQNNFIATIIDSSVDLISVFDNELRFLTLNKRADDIYKAPRETIIGRRLEEVFPRLKDSPFVAQLRRAFAGEFIHDEAYKSAVSPSYFENFFIPMPNHRGEVDRVMVIGHDITNVMLANEKLKQVNAELETSNHDLEQFAYVASHDLQEPLRKIKTFSELSERNLQHPEILKRYLNKISSSATRMTDLIKAVLNYSRLTRTEGLQEKVDLNAVIQHITNDLELFIEEKKATVHTDHLPVVKGGSLQMNQLFLNLFTNALKFSEAAPVISIRAAVVGAEDLPVEATERDHKTYVRISFADNGIGFDQQYAEKVFAIFQRLHPTDKYAGTGIGLALCKKIVETHGGCITVESESGRGTTFFIYLPFDPALQDERLNAPEQLNTAQQP